MNELKIQLKNLIIDSLGLEEINAEDIMNDTPLFGDEGLGLDSVDALELGLAIQKTFGFTLDKDHENLQEHFYSIDNLATFIKSRS